MDKKPLLFGCGGLLIAVIVIAVIIGGWAASVNNRLVTLQESMKASWAQVDTVLQRHYDLIPNLVATVKGYASHERKSSKMWPGCAASGLPLPPSKKKQRPPRRWKGPCRRLLVVAENYPELKASQNFRDLQFELSGTENRISVERQRYNETVKAYNTVVRQFPTALIASFLGFKVSDAYFNAAPAATEAPKVQF